MADVTDGFRFFSKKSAAKNAGVEGDSQKPMEDVPIGCQIRGGGGGEEDDMSSSAEYTMTNKHRGLCVIINQRDFATSPNQLTTRVGTDKDAEDAKRTFTKLGFQVVLKENLTAQGIRDVYQWAAYDSDELNKDADCFATVILSHGEQDYIYGTDAKVRLGAIAHYFKGDVCRPLHGKPKLFFIQACRGDACDGGADVMQDGGEDDVLVQNVFAEVDFFMAYSTVPGYLSYRSKTKGTWFINSLCKVFERHAANGVELMHMMTLVHRLIAYDFSVQIRGGDEERKQMPSTSSMLVKLVFFRDKKS